MIGSDYSLELCNIFHSDQVEPASCFQSLFGAVQTGLILKDVSLEVKAGEVLAVLGSKGSGKRALLEVISRRSHGPTRGQILLDGSPMTLSLFQKTCGYVNHKAQLIPTLSVEQTIYYAANLAIGPQMSPYLKNSRVRQVLADLALSQVSRWSVSRLSVSEYRRLVIGTQLIKDPAVLLLDEPTADLDPLTTYLIVSMLSSHAKRRSRAVILTMEKPRSDVFPFLDRVTYLCLGDVVYTGPTRLMLEYFKAIGFPCPQLENPLMYYLCLSTVDRRSRERFIESNTQIIALVEKFKMEGGPYRKSSASASTSHLLGSTDHNSTHGNSHKMPYSAIGRPGVIKRAYLLYGRLFAATFSLTYDSMLHLIMRLCILPVFFAILWLFYHNMQNYQWTFVSRNGLILMCMIGTYVMSILNTAYTFSTFRNCYYEESREGYYSGPLFLLTYWLFSIPFSIITIALASSMAFQVTGLKGLNEWYLFGTILWACYLLAEQQTIAIMMVVRSSFITTVSSIYLTMLYLILGSGIMRSYRSMTDWLIYLSYITQSRYVAAFLSRQLFGEGRFSNLPQDNGVSCATITTFNSDQFGCRYLDGGSFLSERYGGHESADYSLADLLDLKFNMIASFVFPVSLAVINCLLYLIPLPGFIKSKFRN